MDHPMPIRWAAFATRKTVVQPWGCLGWVSRATWGSRVSCRQCQRRLSQPLVGVITVPSRFLWLRNSPVRVPDWRTGDPLCAECLYAWYGIDWPGQTPGPDTGTCVPVAVPSHITWGGTRSESTYGHRFHRPDGDKMSHARVLTLSVRIPPRKEHPMAFVRWRGNCAQLLATVTDQGRSRHRLLANLHGAYRTTPSLRRHVAQRFPTIVVDWAAIDRALAQGPATAPAPTPQQLIWAETAHQLLEWATNPPYRDAAEHAVLTHAAAILTGWQSSRPS